MKGCFIQSVMILDSSWESTLYSQGPPGISECPDDIFFREGLAYFNKAFSERNTNSMVLQ